MISGLHYYCDFYTNNLLVLFIRRALGEPDASLSSAFHVCLYVVFQWSSSTALLGVMGTDIPVEQLSNALRQHEASLQCVWLLVTLILFLISLYGIYLTMKKNNLIITTN